MKFTLKINIEKDFDHKIQTILFLIKTKHVNIFVYKFEQEFLISSLNIFTIHKLFPLFLYYHMINGKDNNNMFRL